MRYTISTLVILLFIGLSYFIFPHQLFPTNVAENASKKMTEVIKKYTTIPSPTHIVGVAGAATVVTPSPSVTPKK
jgi:hypothetical protein